MPGASTKLFGAVKKNGFDMRRRYGGECKRPFGGFQKTFEWPIVSEITVRAATVDDAEQICSVHADSIRWLDGPYYSAKQIEVWTSRLEPKNYVRGMTERREKMFVAVRKNRVVGFGAIEGEEIKAVYISPDHVRLGAGASICRALETHAIQNGVKSVHLKSSLQAEPFYLKLGYVKVAESKYELSNEVSLEAVEMVKALTA